jgi:metal transporter CNNM
MALLLPITYPIAKLLDKVLHEEEDSNGAFDRGEISALVRIQYEERLALKRRRKLERMDSTRLNSSSNFSHPKSRPPDLEAAIKTAKVASSRNLIKMEDSFLDPAAISGLEDVQSIHVDEVTMVEGALQMKTKTAFDVFTPLHRMFAVPADLILNEDNVVDIYSSGYSRIPVYDHNPLKPKSQTAIKGVLNTKNLIVVNMNEDRPLETMPLATPPCVSPKMNLVELVNLFQTGRYGHFAVVCARPNIGAEAFKAGSAIPDAAGVMG